MRYAKKANAKEGERMGLPDTYVVDSRAASDNDVRLT